MMKHFFIFIFTLIGLIFGGWFLFNYVLISEEEQVYRVIERGRRGVENGSLMTIQSVLSEREDATFQRMQRAEVLGALRQWFQETSERRIRLNHVDIQLDEEKESAEVRIRFMFQCTAPSPLVRRAMPLNQEQTQRVHVILTKSSGDWKIWRVTLNP